MTEKDKLFHDVAARICGKKPGVSSKECLESKANLLCAQSQRCRIFEKTEEQLGYVVNVRPLDENSFLRACAGSGKTEVVGLKAAFEIKEWTKSNAGIAVLAFTNSATDVIRERILQFVGACGTTFPHFVGTIDKWLLNVIANPFAHLITQYPGISGDRSIRIVDKDSQADFLNNYQILHKNSKPIKANQYHRDRESSQYVFSKTYSPVCEWSEGELYELKRKLLKDGFATFHDIENICHNLLSTFPELGEKLASRYPIIVIDECQDLSWIQIEILHLLQDQGAKFHLVGDLNQAIYGFKRVDPSKIQKFIDLHVATRYSLTENFRSVQPIVDLCGKLANQGIVKGRTLSDKQPKCVLFVYEGLDGLSELPGRFASYLEKHGYEISNSAILARGTSTINKMRSLSSPEGLAYKPPLAIQLWRRADLESIKEALSYMGEFVSRKYFNCSCDARNQYCPTDVSSHLMWRRFLSRVLDECCNDSDLAHLNQTWSDWTRGFKARFPAILERCIVADSDIAILHFGLTLRSPKGESQNPVTETLSVADHTPDTEAKIRITTFHDAKGETFEAVMVVSALNRSGGVGGYWQEWLDPSRENGEYARYAYVASSRPSHLLAWAIPQDDNGDYSSLEELGFTLVDEM